MLVRALQAAYRWSLRGAAARWEAAVREPERAQGERIASFLRRNAGSAYGVAHGFAGISTIGEFQRRVPVVDYDTLEPWVTRLANGEQAVLTPEPVRMIERSGGSTSTSKLIPYTQSLFDEFSAATSAWIADLLEDRGLGGTRQYWSISPVARERTTTPGGIPIGVEDDTEYLGAAARWAIGRLMVVPSSVRHLTEIDVWRRETLRHLVAAEDLGLISVWSPSFLTLLLDSLAGHLEECLIGLPPARAAVVRAAVSSGPGWGGKVWPRLRLVSCWTDGPAAEQLAALRTCFPETPIQGKGLLATEGVVSIPLRSVGSSGTVLAVGSHFLEFIDLDRPAEVPVLAHALREGAIYSPVLTTGGGFARYHLKDVVRCTGRHVGTPLIRFEGKLDRVSDVCGEKINARQVDEGLARACAATGARLEFALLAPAAGPPPAYVLYVESGAPADVLERVREALEAYLATGHHYGYCRRLGQLGPMRVVPVRRGWETFERTLRGLGLRSGDIKPTHLDARSVWSAAFATPPDERARGSPR